MFEIASPSARNDKQSRSVIARGEAPKQSNLNKEIINLLIDKALNKSEYYQSKCKGMEERYGTNFDNFKKMVESSGKENFTEWDDLIVWEGYELGFKEWKNKYEELKYCME